MDEFSQPLEDRKVEKGFMFVSAIASLVVGLIVMGFFLNKVMQSHSVPHEGQVLNFEHWGAFGDFIAGVAGTFFSLGGFFLLYLTLQDQRENFHKERLENNFFEMVRFHRDNVDELQFTYYESHERESKVTAEKRKVFKLIVLHFKEAWEELRHFFADVKLDAIYKKEYLGRMNCNQRIKGRTIDLAQMAKIDIIYHIVFFGLSHEDRLTIASRLAQKYQPTFVDKVLAYASLKPKRQSKYWSNWDAIERLPHKVDLYNQVIKKREDPNFYTLFLSNVFYPDDYDKYYGGHQFRLGHYYRHMYAAVNFIDREKFLSSEEKYFYVKILRVQLSNYEQIALFLNTVSGLGRAWELEGDRPLISTYNLITNIPSQYIMGDINIWDYYPDVNYADTLLL